MPRSYEDFIADKSQFAERHGFRPKRIPSFLFDFQAALVEWAIAKGRAAIFADCGLGKTPMQLVWADNVVRHTNKPVLILTPLAVSYQTEREAEKFGIDAKRSNDGKYSSKIVVTNYERLHYFNSSDFAGVVCDESSIMKNFDGKRKKEITEFMRTRPYRLLCTATAAPNDYFELGTSSEALGYLGFSDMLTRFFKQEARGEFKGLGWVRQTYRFCGHSEQPFWRWICSWARACRRPSDLGFKDDDFVLPPLNETSLCIQNTTPRQGMLFSTPAKGLREEREERRITIKERCEKAAEIAVSRDGPAILWCQLNDEGDLLEKVVPESLQVAGSMPDELKEERLLAFQRGELKRLVIKPKIGCFGLNYQHCNNVVTFATHSYEQHYQAVRRCWRFGQKRPVFVTIIATEGESMILRNMQRKSAQADEMFTSLVKHMNESMKLDGGWVFDRSESVPGWLQTG